MLYLVGDGYTGVVHVVLVGEGYTGVVHVVSRCGYMYMSYLVGDGYTWSHVISLGEYMSYLVVTRGVVISRWGWLHM